MNRPRKRKGRRLSLGNLPLPVGAETAIVNDDEKEMREARERGGVESLETIPITPGHPAARRRTPLQTPRNERPSASSSSSSGLRHTPLSHKSPMSYFAGRDSAELQRQVLDNAQLSELYSNCIKLSTHNKINQKNSWGLQLIDYLSEVISQQEEEQPENAFQKASHTLDASVKIWSYRVDSVHSQTYKVLGGFSSGDSNSNAGGNPLNSAARERRRNAAPTLVQPDKMHLINVEEHEVAYQVDPMFLKMASAFDEGGAKGLLMNNLGVRDGPRIVFDSDFDLQTPRPEQAVPIENGKDVLDFLCQQFGSSSKGSSAVCETVNLYEREIEGLEKALEMNASDQTGGDQVSDQDSEKDLNRQLTFSDDAEDDAFDLTLNDPDGGHLFEMSNFDEMIDEENQMQLELGNNDDGDGGDGGDGHGDGDRRRDDMRERFGLRRRGGEEDDDDDFADLDHLKVTNWAGPDRRAKHWLFGRKKTRPDARKKRKRKAKNEYFIDFSGPDIPDEVFAPPPRGPKQNQMSARTIEKNMEDMNMLPNDYHYKPSMFTKLFHRRDNPYKHFRRSKEPLAEPVEIDHDEDDSTEPWYDYNNPNDVQNYCPDVPVDDGHPHQGDDEGSFDHLAVEGIDLVDRPKDVRTISVNFSKTAKRVNVTHLKNQLWRSLQTEESEQLREGNKENQPNEDVVMERGKEEEKDTENTEKGRKTVQLKSFQESISSLGETLPREAIDVLSVPYCFISLLHLANEKDLNLEQLKSSSSNGELGNDDLGNFYISQNL